MHPIAPMSLPRTPSGGRVTQVRVILSEWTKFRSLRSTRYTLLATVGLTVGLALAAAILVVSQWDTMTAANKATFQPLNVSLVGASIGVMVIGVLGVLMMTSEFTTGLVSSTFAAVPKRLPVLWGKAAVYSVIALSVTVPAMLVAFFSTQAILSGQSRADCIRTRRRCAGGLRLGALPDDRRTAGNRTRRYLPQHRGSGHQLDRHPVRAAGDRLHSSRGHCRTSSAPYLPGNAGQAIMSIGPQAHALAPWVGLGVFAAYAFAAIALAAVLLVKRDV